MKTACIVAVALLAAVFSACHSPVKAHVVRFAVTGTEDSVVIVYSPDVRHEGLGATEGRLPWHDEVVLVGDDPRELLLFVWNQAGSSRVILSISDSAWHLLAVDTAYFSPAGAYKAEIDTVWP